jgi:putative membrane protein
LDQFGASPCPETLARGSIAAVEERTAQTPDAETVLNVGMAAERTWLAWWRTALVATAGALGVGRLAPRLLHAAPAPYVVLGSCYGVLAVALLIVGSRRHRALARALERGEPAPLSAATVTLFTVGGLVLAAVTTTVVLAQI